MGEKITVFFLFWLHSRSFIFQGELVAELRDECEAVLQQLHCAGNTYFISNKQIKCCQFY